MADNPADPTQLAGYTTAYDAKGTGSPEQPEKGKKAKKLSKRESQEKATEARERIAEAWEHDRDNREEAATDLAFLAGNQWPETVRRERVAAGRPMLTINRLPQFVRQITNDIRQADMAIKVSPEDDSTDPKLAKIFDGIIRQIHYRSSAKHVFGTAAEHQASCGIGWFRVATQYADDMAFDQEIKLKAIPNPMSVYCDPAAVEPDRSDAMWMIVTEMVPRKAFKARYPKAAEANVDQPRDEVNRPFFWATTDDVRIGEYWYKVPETRTLALLQDGETIDVTDMDEFMVQMLPVVRTRKCETHRVEMCIVNGAEVLEGPFEWHGRHIPLIPVIGGEFPLEAKKYRYSAIRFARDPQQLYNYYRTATAETIALAPKAPFIATPAQIGPFKAMWDTAHTKNRPYLLYQPDPEAPGTRPQREPPPELPTALVQEAQIAADDMKSTTGIYDASLGQRSNETAGIAIRARQHEGDVANYHFVDNLQRSLEHCGRILIELIPKIYDNERVIRLMGEDGNEEPIKINQVIMQHDGVPMMINDLSQASFDVRVNIGRSYSTKRAETADAMLEFMKTVPGAAQVMGDLVAKALDFPEADVIAKRLKNMIPPQVLTDPDDPNAPPPPNPMDDPAVQLEMAAKEADVEAKKAATRKTYAEAIKTELEAQQLAEGAEEQEEAEAPGEATEMQDPFQHVHHEANARKAMAEAAAAEHKAKHAELETMSRVRDIERGDMHEQQEQAASAQLPELIKATIMEAMSMPKEIVRGPDGRAVGVRIAQQQQQPQPEVQ